MPQIQTACGSNVFWSLQEEKVKRKSTVTCCFVLETKDKMSTIHGRLQKMNVSYCKPTMTTSKHMSSPKLTWFSLTTSFMRKYRELTSHSNSSWQLRLLVRDCNYANPEEMVQDRVVFGINSPKVREKLPNIGSDLTLDKAIDIARSHDMAQAQFKSFTSCNVSPRKQQSAGMLQRETITNRAMTRAMTCAMT